MTTFQTERVCELNDVFRTTWLTGTVLMTAGVHSLPEETQSRIAEAVQGFDDFTPDSDPYGEHDFGVVTVDGCKVLWKIDYYDPTMQYRSEDPANPSVTKRVLTIMLADEFGYTLSQTGYASKFSPWHDPRDAGEESAARRRNMDASASGCS